MQQNQQISEEKAGKVDRRVQTDPTTLEREEEKLCPSRDDSEIHPIVTKNQQLNQLSRK